MGRSLALLLLDGLLQGRAPCHITDTMTATGKTGQKAAAAVLRSEAMAEGTWRFPMILASVSWNLSPNCLLVHLTCSVAICKIVKQLMAAAKHPCQGTKQKPKHS